MTQILTIMKETAACCDKDEHFRFPVVLLFALINSIQQGIILLIAVANSCLLKASVMRLAFGFSTSFNFFLTTNREKNNYCILPSSSWDANIYYKYRWELIEL